MLNTKKTQASPSSYDCKREEKELRYENCTSKKLEVNIDLKNKLIDFLLSFTKASSKLNVFVKKKKSFSNVKSLVT